MDKKYWVPALEKADQIIRAIAKESGKLRLIDLSRKLDIHKSSMYSILLTLEQLGWISRSPADTYELGSRLGSVAVDYLEQYDYVRQFRVIGPAAVARIGETLQLAKLEGDQVFYLAKEEAASVVRIISNPGMRFPAYCTSLGKSMLAALSNEVVSSLYSDVLKYPEGGLPAFTPHTLKNCTDLLIELESIRKSGFAYDLQESVIGICCVGTAIYDVYGKPTAAISFSMSIQHWEEKLEKVKSELTHLSKQLSMSK